VTAPGRPLAGPDDGQNLGNLKARLVAVAWSSRRLPRASRWAVYDRLLAGPAAGPDGFMPRLLWRARRAATAPGRPLAWERLESVNRFRGRYGDWPQRGRQWAAYDALDDRLWSRLKQGAHNALRDRLRGFVDDE
jgi:hypothetical protein